MPHMPVSLPRMCSVLAHELRSPLSVIQGYIRLLQRQRGADHPDTPMLDAMLEATGRLTVIARQASDLGNWLSGPGTRPLETTRASRVLAALSQRVAPETHVQVLTGDGAPDAPVHADEQALSGALAAVAEALYRDVEPGTVEISLKADGENVAFRFQAHRRTTAEDHVSAGPGAPAREFSFDRGGAGLALIAASHVFDRHQAVLEPATEPDALLVRLPHLGGTP
jgi:signal transduction histidine kinase